jgi:hypothetical protein
MLYQGLNVSHVLCDHPLGSEHWLALARRLLGSHLFVLQPLAF